MHDRRRFLTAASALALTAWGAARAAPNASAAPAFGDLGRELEGTLVQRTDDAYEATREAIVWQRMKPSRYPAAIVKAASVADVRTAVRYAAKRGMRLSVRCGGHNFPGVTLQDGTLCLDVSALGGVSIDPERRVASIGPAVSGGEFVWHLERHGLGFPVPHCGAVPLSGYLLGGGIGWNGDRWGGFACLNIEAVELVTPDGELLTASPTQNPDWYWLVRGAGPLFFGVVTRFHLRLYPQPGAIMTSTFAWTFDDLPEAAGWLTDMASALPLDVELLGVVGSGTPQADGAATRGSYLMSATAFADDAARARELLEPIGRGDVVKRCVERTEFTPTPFELLFEWDAAAFPWARWCADNIWSNARPPDVLDRLAGAFREAPSPRSTAVCLFRRNREPLPDAALSVRGGLYVAWYGSWDEPAHDRANTDWSARTAAAVRDLATGHYINETDYLARPDQGTAAFTDASRARIAAMRQRHDPGGIFHVPFGGRES